MALALREECRRKLTGNSRLWGVLGAKGDAVTENWSKMHNVELHELEMGGECNTYFGEKKCIEAVGWEI